MANFDPGWEGYLVWQTGLPALAGHPTYHVNAIKLKWEVIWIQSQFVNKNQRIVHGQGASNINYNTVDFNFDVCRLSYPVSSTSYVRIYAPSAILFDWKSEWLDVVIEIKVLF